MRRRVPSGGHHAYCSTARHPRALVWHCASLLSTHLLMSVPYHPILSAPTSNRLCRERGTSWRAQALRLPASRAGSNPPASSPSPPHPPYRASSLRVPMRVRACVRAGVFVCSSGLGLTSRSRHQNPTKSTRSSADRRVGDRHCISRDLTAMATSSNLLFLLLLNRPGRFILSTHLPHTYTGAIRGL